MTHHFSLADINWWAWDPHHSPMGWFLLDFALFLGLLMYFVARPLRSALAERHQNVRQAVTHAAAQHAKATADQQLWSRKLAALDQEIREHEQASLKDGEAEVAQMVGLAERRAEQIRADSKTQAEQYTRQAHERLRQVIMGEALSRARDTIVSQTNEHDQARLIAEATESVCRAPHSMTQAPRAHA